MTGRLASTAVSTTVRSETRSFRSVSLSLVMREASSKSSISRTMCESWRSIMLRVSTTMAASVHDVEHLETAAQGSERVSQFVGEGRQKLVLPPVGLLQGFLGPLPIGDVLGQPEHKSTSPPGAEFGNQAGGDNAAFRRGPRSRTRSTRDSPSRTQTGARSQRLQRALGYRHRASSAEILVAGRPVAFSIAEIDEHVPQLPVEPVKMSGVFSARLRNSRSRASYGSRCARPHGAPARR